MNCFITSVLLSFLLNCIGDVSESRTVRLPLSPLERIPSPLQSIFPLTFDNPIKDYNVGLEPPSSETSTQKKVTEFTTQHRYVPYPVHQRTTHYAPKLIKLPVQLRPVPQQPGVNSLGSVQTVYRHSTNQLQPQVYQPKTVIYQRYHQPNMHHHHHQEQRINAYGGGYLVSPPSQQLSRDSVAVTQSAIYQNSAHAHHKSDTMQRLSTVIEHIHPSVQHSDFASRSVTSSALGIVQAYPSVSYEATVPQHGSTLNFGSAKPEPELISIISEVLGRQNF